jgi:hypothetical protein
VEMHIGTIIAKTIGVILLLLSLIFVPASKTYFRQRQALSFRPWERPDNLFMYISFLSIERLVIIPFLVGVGLVLSCSLWLILVLSVAWILSFAPFCPFFFTFMTLLRIVCGWAYGGLVYFHLFFGSGKWFYESSGIGALCMFLVYYVVIIITMPDYLRRLNQ